MARVRARGRARAAAGLRRACLGAGGGRARRRGVTLLAVVFDTWPHRGLDDAWTALHDAPAVRAPFDQGRTPPSTGWSSSRRSGSRSARCSRPRRAGSAMRLSRPLRSASGSRRGCSRTRNALVLGARRSRQSCGRRSSRARATRRAARGLALGAASSSSPGRSRRRRASRRPRGAHRLARLGSLRRQRPEGQRGYVWDAHYGGIEFPARPTVVLRVRAPKRAEYWRVSTLETFAADRWIENLYPVDLAGPRRRLPADPLVPRRDARPGAWLRQVVTVEGLEDDRSPPRASPPGSTATLGRVLYLDGGVMRAGGPLRRGTEYTVWSYAPRPTPRALAASTGRGTRTPHGATSSSGAPGCRASGCRAASGPSTGLRRRPLPAALGVPAALGGGAAAHGARALAVRGDAAARALVPAGGRLPLRGAAAAGRRAPAARRLRRGDACSATASTTRARWR